MMDNVLYLDTESDPVTKKLRTIQLRMNGENVIINHPKKRKLLKEWMDKAKCIVAFNAPYDLGALSIIKGNSYEWEKDKDGGGKWQFMIEGYQYEVRKLAFASSHIKSHGKAPPIFDVFKLWALLISGDPKSLEDIVWDEFKHRMIPWSDENSKTVEYQLQDVIWLEKVYHRFFERIADIEEVADYTYKDWESVCTQATFPKRMYEKVYGKKTLKAWRKHNLAENHKFGLSSALEEAYNGGITCSLHRGILVNTVWEDINGAYANVMKNENTDQYKKYHWEKITPPAVLPRDNYPILCRTITDGVLTSMNNSLKLFRLVHPTRRYMWSYDIRCLPLIWPDVNIKITDAWIPIPENPVTESLPKIWSGKREALPGDERNGPRGLLYKFMSNTSYGINAQMDPWPTIHTNPVIKGIITSRAHLILGEMIDEARKNGYKWHYSDTDSICVSGGEINPIELDEKLNKRIGPYSCGCELIGTTRVLSLKRYMAYDGVDKTGEKAKDKIKIHGKSVYNITREDILEMLNGNTNYEPLLIKQMTANTPVTLKMLKKLCPEITHPHPFMFVKNIPDKHGRSKQDWFNETWFPHEDDKLDWPEGAKVTDEYARNFFQFDNMTQARLFYDDKSTDEINPDVEITKNIVDWDKLAKQLLP